VVGWTVDVRPQWGWVAALHWREGSQEHVAEWRFADPQKNPFPQPANELGAAISATANTYAEWRPAKVLPESWALDEQRPRAARWNKKTRKSCNKNPELCDAMGLVFEQRDLMTTLAWYLTDSPASRHEIEACKSAHTCMWGFSRTDSPTQVAVFYDFVSDGEADQVAFLADLERGVVGPADA